MTYISASRPEDKLTWNFHCPRCHWRGVGSEVPMQPDDVIHCPRCPRGLLERDEETAHHLAIEARGGKLLTLHDCPRCGGFHEQMTFERITPRWGWQATCPETGEAVFLSVTAPTPGLPMPSEMTAEV